MAISWGGWSGHMRVGIEVRHDGYDTNTPSINVYVDFWVQCDSTWNFGDSQRLNISGNVGGGWDFYNNLGPNQTKFIGTATIYNQGQSYGGGPTYWLHGQISGHYQGATPAHGINWTLPARPPNVPTNPPVWVSEVTSSSARINVNPSDGRGSNVDAYETAVSWGGPNWGGWHQSWGGGTGYATNLAPATTYEGAARAHNGVGWSGWSYTGYFTTGAVAPNAPGTPSFSSVAQTTATAAWTASSNNGGSAISNYGIQVSKDSNFSQVVQDFETGNTSLSRALADLVPGTQYWMRVRSRNGVGWSPFSGAGTFTTLAGTPVIITPANGASLQSGLIDVTVEALGIAADRRITLEVSTDSGFATILHTVVLNTTGGASANNRYRLQGNPDTQFLPNGTYYVRAKVTNLTSGYITPWSGSVSFTQAHTPSAQLQGPANGGTFKYAATTQFSWAFVDAAAPTDLQTNYQLVIENNDTGAVVYDSGKTALASTAAANISTVSVAIATAHKSVLLRWRVRVWDRSDQVSPYTNYHVFRLADPPVVAITDPQPGLPVSTGNPTFVWTVSVPSGLGIASSKITVREASTNAIVWEKTITGGTLQATPEATILVNNISYSVTVLTTDGGGLTSEASVLFTTQYVAPDPIIYTVDASDVNDAGRILVDWNGQAADSRLIAWRVYRRELPSATWERIAEIPDANVRMWADYLVKSGHVYMYTVTQLADRSGAILESPLGQRGKVTTLPTRTNRVKNPHARVASGYSVNAGTSGTSTLTYPTTGGPDGGNFARHTQTAAQTGATASIRADGRANMPTPIPVTPGEVVSAAVQIRSSVEQRMAASLWWFDAAGAQTGISPSSVLGTPQVLTPNTWTRLIIQNITVPANAAYCLVGASQTSGTGHANLPLNATLDLTMVQLETASTIGAYFDGSQGSDATYSVRWTGAPDASTSERYETPFFAEAQIEQPEIENYWLIVEDYPEYTVKLTNVTSNSETTEYEDETFTLIGRGRHTDYGDRLGASGSLNIQIRQLERESQLRKKLEDLRDLRENYYLRTPFGRLYKVSLGNPGWTPIAGTGWAEMGDMTLPWQEVA